MAAIDDAARRTRAAIADYDQKRKFIMIADIAEWSTPEKRGRARAERDAALVAALGATEYLLELIDMERNVIT